MTTECGRGYLPQIDLKIISVIISAPSVRDLRLGVLSLECATNSFASRSLDSGAL